MTLLSRRPGRFALPYTAEDQGVQKNLEYLIAELESNQILNPVPVGMIALWSGAISAIPAGWALCDGTNGTPDLRDKFVKGAAADTGTDPLVGASGGAKEHTHEAHASAATTQASDTTEVQAGTGAIVASESHDHDTPSLAHANADGSNPLTNHEPPWYALAFIQKLA